MSLISIIDYGSGNIRSVYNALNFLCAPQKQKVIVTKKFSEINKSSHIILPGVGSFESCINGLKESSLIPILEEKIIEKKLPVHCFFINEKEFIDFGQWKEYEKALNLIR